MLCTLRLVTPVKVPSEIRSGVSHVGDTQVLEKRRYVDRELPRREGGREGKALASGEGDGGEHGITLPSAVAGGQVYAGEPQVVTHSAPALQRSPYSHLYRVEGGEPDRL